MQLFILLIEVINFIVGCAYNFVGSVNFLIADGLKFSHPLHHLGKGAQVNSNITMILLDLSQIPAELVRQKPCLLL